MAEAASIARVFAQHNARVGDPREFGEGADFNDTHARAVEREVRAFASRSHDPTQQGLEELNAPLTQDEVALVLLRLPNGKAASPEDNVANEMLKMGGEGGMTMVAAFFGMQWELEHKARTRGVVVELHKGGDKDKAATDSYRPITLLSCLDRAYDRVLNNRLMRALEEHNLLHNAQSGFRSEERRVGKECRL